MVLPIIIPPDAAARAASGASGYVYACAGDTPLDAYPVHAQKHLHGVIDCMVEVWISPVTFLLTLINRSNYSISIALRHRIYTLQLRWHTKRRRIRDIAIGDVLKRLSNDYSVVSSSLDKLGNMASLGMVTFVSEVSFLLSDVSVLTRSLSVTIS